MINKSYFNTLFCIFSISSFCLYSSDGFVESFLSCYDISPQGLYARGYPDYLATKSKNSLVQLENSVRESGIEIEGRIVISGYERNAYPSIRFDFEDNSRLNDEQSLKGKSGWSFAPGNTFGFTTGFLFKDVNSLQNNKIFSHIGHEDIELFHGTSEILQKEAFGDNFAKIYSYKKAVNYLINSESCNSKIFKILVDYWQDMYKQEKLNRAKQISATQDILFSILYGTYLGESDIELIKFFTGPDITYPIRVLPVQPLQATRSSQEFLKTFVDELKPRGGKTAYIFCSFVDGVGKSTSLGNIINYIEHKDDFVNYGAVNNSSSQLATLYNFSQDVVIVDLPAQVSHFCAKPVGKVFVGLNTMKLEKDFESRVLSNFLEKEKEYQQVFVSKYREIIASLSTFKPKNDFEYYILNLIRLGTDSQWFPFEFEGKVFVIGSTNEIKVLVSLDEAHSSGLKVREPELMLFDGAIIPMNYKSFLEKLIYELKSKGIEKVVFVDYISMYPRSSRENIRINFMLQQLKQLFEDRYHMDNSFYRSFGNSYEIYPMITVGKDKVLDSWILEAMSRSSLNDCILNESHDDVLKFTFDELIEKMRSKIALISSSEVRNWYALAESRLKEEAKDIDYYKFNKIVESCWMVPRDKVAELSQRIAKIFSREIIHNELNNLWSDVGEVVEFDLNNNKVTFASGARGTILFSIDEDSHDAMEVEEFNNILRAGYYSTIFSLFVTENPQLPGFVVAKNGSRYYIVQKHSDLVLSVDAARNFDTSKNDYLYGFNEDGESCYYLSYARIYAIEDDLKPYNILGNTDLLMDAAKNFYVRTSTFYSTVKEVYGAYGLQLGVPAFNSTTRISRNNSYVSLVVNMIATIEHVLKHPKSAIMSRYGNYEDYVGCVHLIEALTMPNFCGTRAQLMPQDIKPIIKIDWKR